jgi:threonine synthase
VDVAPRATAWLACIRCGTRFAIGPAFGCPTCRAEGRTQALEVDYDLDALREAVRTTFAFAPGPGAPPLDDPGIWRWRALLPPVDAELTLGEGRTPLLPSRRAGPTLGLDRVLLKYEGANPTGSYKDRFQAVSIAAAKGLGFSRAFCASTGNHGLAAAAYARLAGLGCLVLLHEEAPASFDEAIASYGATVARIPPGERDPLMRRLLDEAWFPATCLAPLPVPNPFGAEGYKTLAFEVKEQMGMPDAVVVPVGAGDGLYGVAKGFAEMLDLDVIDRAPRVFGVQPRGADPLVRAAVRGADEVEALEQVAASPALSIREAATGDHALRAARQLGGGAVAVDDAAIVRAAELLADDGLLVDVASAASLAGAAQLVANGVLPATATIVCVITASGARWPRPPGYQPAGRVIRGRAADVLRFTS